MNRIADKNSHCLALSPQVICYLLPGCPGKEFQYDNPERQFLLNKYPDNISCGIAKCVKDYQERFFLELVYDSARDQNPDRYLKKRKNK